MAVEDYLESEVAVAVAVTAVALSPKARKVVRRGAVYGLAGAMMAGDAAASFARGVSRGVQDAAASAAHTVHIPGHDGSGGTAAEGGEA